VWSREPLDGFDVYAYLGAFSYQGPRSGIDVLITLEPIVVLPGEYAEEVWKHFDHVFTFVDGLAEHWDKFHKILFPAFDFPFDKNYCRIVDRSFLSPQAEKKNAICMISGNKKSSIPGELYSKRVEVARWFSEHSKTPFDVFGKPGFQLPNYIGPLTPYSQKFATLAQYRYSLSFENIYDPIWSKGYLSEKLLDCFMCETVPIYLGCYNIEEYVPKNCFIDFRQFTDYGDLDQFLHNLREREYKSYIDHIRNWVNAGNLSRYSMYPIYDKLLTLVHPNVSEKELAIQQWQPGLAACHNACQWRINRIAPVWTWSKLASTKPSEEILRGKINLAKSGQKESSKDCYKSMKAKRIPIAEEETDKSVLLRWFQDHGDSTLRLDYPLTRESVVIDVGGYLGEWSQKIADRYDPYIYIIEPVHKFHSFILERFRNNRKVKVFDFGLLDKTKKETMVLDHDSSSLFTSKGKKVPVYLMDVVEFLKEQNIKKIDLIKINIEGAEYPLLRHMIDKGIVENCRDIQVQFHTFYPDAVRLRNEIREDLKKTHSLTYDYPFVWENWTRMSLSDNQVTLGKEPTEKTANVILLSYPRSGSTWLRYCIEFLTKRLTIGYVNPGVSMENGLGKLVDIGVDCTKSPILYKRHGHTPNEKSSWDMDHDKLILLVRNYKECMVRHLSGSTSDLDASLYSQTQGYRDGSLDYIGCLQIYEEWRGTKIRLYYEDLIRDPEPQLVRVLQLLNVDDTYLPELMKNLDFHKKQSVKIYAGEEGHVSYTKGHTDSLLFHSRNLDEKRKRRWDQHLQDRYPDLVRKHLDRYREPEFPTSHDITSIIFSKDRAMQLDATLRSFFLHCKDSDSVSLKVLYVTSNQSYEQQYEQLKDEFKSVEFIKETDFKKDLLSLLSSKQYVLFLVDDNIFIRTFCISDIRDSLDNNPDVLGFSLRLGKNTTYCYMLNVEQKLPSFSVLGGGILKYEWIAADHDFGYPFEVSSSVYRVSDIYTLLAQADFSNPNTLELVVDGNKGYFRPNANQLLCYEHSVTFCNPVNVVQALWQNKAGERFAYSSKKLADMFSDGMRIDVEKYATITPNACHYEVAFDFIKKEPLVSIVILNYNGLKHIKLCLESIERNTPERHETIVVDNASSDGSRAYLRSIPHITLVENRTNVGCPPARNQAIALAKGDFVVFLDNDTIVTPGWLNTFIDHAQRHPEIGILGPCSNFVTGPQLVQNITYTGLDGIDSFARDFYKKNRNRLQPTHRLVGFCMFIRRGVIDKIGAHDPQFGKFGFEDEDFTWRTIIAGYQVAIAEDVFIHHAGGPQLRGDKVYNKHLRKAWDIFKHKWELPPDLPLRPGLYIEEVLKQPYDPIRHYTPSPERSEVEDLVYKRPVLRRVEKSSSVKREKGFVRLIIWSPNDSSTDDVKRCLSCVKRFTDPASHFSVVWVNIEENLCKDILKSRIAFAATPEVAIQEALTSDITYIALLSTNVVVTNHWLKKLVEIADSDASIAAVGPTSNRVPSSQRVKKGYKSLKKELQKFAKRRAHQFGKSWDSVSYLGAFCLLLRTNALLQVGCLDESLALPKALWGLYRRLHHQGFELACAKGVYVHQNGFTDDEGATYDLWAEKDLSFDETLTVYDRSVPEEEDQNMGCEDELPDYPRPGVLSEKPTVSVCMIVRDEEKVLRRCLTSVRSIADELILVDTGSKDNTVAIAKEFGAKLFHFEWCDDFSAARNETLKNATGDWIFQIDADEELLPSSIRFLKKQISDPWSLICMISIDNGPTYSERFFKAGRLFRNHPQIRYSRSYHETIETSTDSLTAAEPDWRVVYDSKIVVRHYGYEDSVKDEKGKLVRELYMLESYVKDNPKDQSMRIRLAELYNQEGRYDEAIDLCKEVLVFDPDYVAAHHILGMAYCGQGRLDEGIVEYKKAIDLDPELPWVRYHLGIVYNDKGEFDKAILEFKRTLNISPNLGKVHTSLGVAFHMKGMLEEAFNEYQQAISIDPADTEAHFNLGILYRNRGMLAEAIKEYKKALADDPLFAEAHNNLAVTYFMQKKYKLAIKHSDKAIEMGFNVNPAFLKELDQYRK
jgi:FkbM family methyltransferase